MNYGDDDARYVAEVEGRGEDGEDRDESVEAEDDAHTWHISGSEFAIRKSAVRNYETW